MTYIKNKPRPNVDLEVGQRALTMAAQAIEKAATTLGDSFEQAVDLLAQCRGNIVVTGVGKSAHIAAKISATLNSTGSKAMFLHAGEALHGDLGAVGPEDVVMCLSKSGSSEEIVGLLPALGQRKCPIVALTAQPDSPLGQAASVMLDIDVPEEACRFDLAPTTSTSLQLALGDALALALMERSGFQPDDFAMNHPAGALGKKLTWTLAQLTDCRRKPAVHWEASLDEVLRSMSEGGYGATVVWDADEPSKVGGIVTDGDLRRCMANGSLEGLQAGGLASRSPKVLEAYTLASTAAQWMQAQGISQVIVMQDDAYLGMVHIHDCLREGLV